MLPRTLLVDVSGRRCRQQDLVDEAARCLVPAKRNGDDLSESRAGTPRFHNLNFQNPASAGKCSKIVENYGKGKAKFRTYVVAFQERRRSDGGGGGRWASWVPRLNDFLSDAPCRAL